VLARRDGTTPGMRLKQDPDLEAISELSHACFSER
jgi:hypothetical protein